MSKRINLSIFFFILIGYLAQVEECSTPEEEEKLICARGQSKATSPLVCRDARLRLAVIAGLPTKNCHLVNTHFSVLIFNFSLFYCSIFRNVTDNFARLCCKINIKILLLIFTRNQNSNLK
jgi:hypothetical protein